MSEVNDLLLALALETVPCPATRNAVALPYCEDHCAHEYHLPWRCKFCHGTGQVARFPMLRGPCRGWPVHPDLYDYRASYCTEDAECECGGRTWVPVSGAGLTNALLEAGKPWELGVWWDKQKGKFVAGSFSEEGNKAWDRTADMPEEALLRALTAAREAGYATS